MINKIKLVIMAGGYGRRLWPLSTELNPKQFLRLCNGKSLFQRTLERHKFLEIKPLVMIQKLHYEIALEQIGEVNISCDVIVEPCPRGTAPCAVLGAIVSDAEKASVFVIAPSDHLIKDITSYEADIKRSIWLASKDNIVTIGISPKSPNTEFGYIKVTKTYKNEEYNVVNFVEKPSLPYAKKYFADKSFYWNSGIFICGTRIFRNLAMIFEPEMYNTVNSAFMSGEIKDNARYLGEIYSSIEDSNSIDYAFMQKISYSKMVKAQFDWKDMGSWEALSETCLTFSIT